MHFKEKLGIHEAEPEPLHEANKFKIGDQVLIEKIDPRISPPDPNTNKEIPFRVISVFPYGTVEVSNPIFGSFNINASRLKFYHDNETDSMRKDFQLFKPH